MKECYLGLHEVNVTQLVEPSLEYANFRVRPTSDTRTSKLTKGFLAAAEPRELLSTFIVSLIPDVGGINFSTSTVDKFRYIVIDGNHRLLALKELFKCEGNWLHETVPCMIYDKLTPTQAIGLGYERNAHDANVIRTSDYDKVFAARQLLRNEKNTADGSKRKGYSEIFKAFNIGTVSTF